MKKKRIIIGIALFLLIGLSIFAFANNKGKDDKLEDKNNKTKIELKKEEEKEDDGLTGTYIAPVDTKVNAVKTVVKKNISENKTATTDDSYDKALAAVIKAEEELTEESYDNAQGLVDFVKDVDKKQELEKRLEEVKNIIDVTKIIEALEAKLGSATNKDDIKATLDERESNDTDNLIDTITDENVRVDLTNRLAKIDAILYDEESPAMAFNDEEGAEVVVASDDILSKLLTLIIADDNDFKVVINNGEEEVDYEDGMLLEDGIYTVTATDKAFNETSLSFAIDTTVPEFNVEDGTISNKELELVVNDLTFDYIEVYNKTADSSYTSEENTITLDGEANYVLTAYDKAGHSREITVIVDTIAPKVELKKNNGLLTKIVNSVSINVNDPFLKSVKVNGREWLEEDNTDTNWFNVYAVLFGDYGDYTIVVTDIAGNVTTETFVIGKKEKASTTKTIAPTVEIVASEDNIAETTEEAKDEAVEDSILEVETEEEKSTETAEIVTDELDEESNIDVPETEEEKEVVIEKEVVEATEDSILVEQPLEIEDAVSEE